MDLRVLSLPLLLAGWSGQAQLEVAPAPRPAATSVSVGTARGETLLGYAWDGGAEVVLGGLGGTLRIDHGGAGGTPDTLLYLPFDHGRAGEEALAPPGAPETWEGRGIAWETGRFGNALGFAAETSSLVVRPPAETTLQAAGWTLEFWIRLASATPKLRSGALRLPGVASVDVTVDRRISVTLERPDGAQFTSEPLLAGEWTYVGFALQAEFLSQARFVVGSQTGGRVLEPAPTAPLPLTLELGARGGRSDGFVGALDDLRLRRYAATTQELLERGLPVPRIGIHRLELRTSARTRVLEPWLGPTGGPELATEEDWSQGALEHVTAQGGALRWVPGHWERLETPVRPLARTTHPQAFLGNHRVLVFGGETRDTHLWPMVNTADTWIFRTDLGSWERLQPGLEPAPRCHESVAYSPDHDLVLLAGGYVNDYGRSETLDDLWVFHGARSAWERREPPGLTPGPMSDWGVLYHPRLRKFLLLKDRTALTYDPATNEWWGRLKVPAAGVDGAPREDFTLGGSFMCGVDPVSGKVVTFGGELFLGGEFTFLDETAEYSPQDETLLVLGLRPCPSPRVRAGFAYDSRRARFVLFGGVQDQFSQRNADLWTYDPRARAWTERLASNGPSGRGGYYGMVYDPDLDRFFLLCGRHSADHFLNEAWSLRLDEQATGRASFVFERASWEGRRWLRLDVPPAGDSRVTLRWRASLDGLSWSDWREQPEALPGPRARFLQLELLLHPGSRGEAPEVRSLRFLAERAADDAARWVDLGPFGR